METSSEALSPEKLLAMRDAMLGQMVFSRDYTLNLIANVPDELWHTPAKGVPTHFAWQIGHLAVAQYGLMLFRQRGRAEGDLDLMPGWLRKRYARGSVPSEEETLEATKSEMLELLAKIHTAAMAFVPTMSAESLAEPTDMPYTRSNSERCFSARSTSRFTRAKSVCSAVPTDSTLFAEKPIR
jgi:hypothetical protein